MRCRRVPGVVSSGFATAAVAMVGLAVCACANSGYAVRPIPRIAADDVGKPVKRLRDTFGAPRKIDTTPYKLVYVWFIEQIPAGAPAGFHGCELEVTVDPMSEHVLGYSVSNLGWAKCSDIVRKVRIEEP